MVKVRVDFKLCGKSYRDFNNSESVDRLYVAHDDVETHFGNRPMVLAREYLVYPEFYVAGWAVCNSDKSGNPGWSELVVLAHGNSLKEANSNMINFLTTLDWTDNAHNV